MSNGSAISFGRVVAILSDQAIFLGLDADPRHDERKRGMPSVIKPLLVIGRSGRLRQPVPDHGFQALLHALCPTKIAMEPGDLSAQLGSDCDRGRKHRRHGVHLLVHSRFPLALGAALAAFRESWSGSKQ